MLSTGSRRRAFRARRARVVGASLETQGEDAAFCFVPIGSYLSMLIGGDVRGRLNW